MYKPSKKKTMTKEMKKETVKAEGVDGDRDNDVREDCKEDDIDKMIKIKMTRKVQPRGP